jgi:hypothetical protein
MTNGYLKKKEEKTSRGDRLGGRTGEKKGFI